MRTLQPPFPNKMTKPLMGAGSVLSEPRLRKSPHRDCFNPHSSPAPLLSPARTLSPNFPESHKIIVSSVWPGSMENRAHGSNSHKTPFPPLLVPHCPVSWRLKQQAGIAVSHMGTEAQRRSNLAQGHTAKRGEHWTPARTPERQLPPVLCACVRYL